MSSTGTVDNIIVQVVTNVQSIECALETTVLYIHMFHSDGKFESTICSESPFPSESYSSSINARDHPLVGEDLQVVGYMNFHVQAIETANTGSKIAVLVISQKASDSKPKLTIDILTHTDGEVQKKGNFESGSTCTNEGMTEILAVIGSSSCVGHRADSFELCRGWSFLHLGKIFPFLESYELLPKIQVKLRLSATVKDEEVLDLLSHTLKLILTQPKGGKYDVRRLGKVTAPMSNRRGCPSMSGSEMRQYDQGLTGAIRLLKGTSKEMKELANRVYATPWKQSCPSISGEDTSKVDGMEIQNLKRQLREEFLEVLENYKTKDKDPTSEKCINRLYQQIELLRRELEEIRQKQTEIKNSLYYQMEYLLSSITSTYATKLTKQSQAVVSDEIENEGKGFTEDVLIRSFRSFSTGFELLSQGLGSSFRALQRSLFYPTAFKDLEPATSPYAKQLLKFVASKEATDLVADIERLAGLWRAAGTHIEADLLFKPILR